MSGESVRHIRKSAIPAMAMALAYSPNAMALDRGTCLPFNQMVAAMEAEGQYDIIKIDDLAPNGEVGLTMYTTNDNMDRGYEISGQRPADGQLPAQLCVDRVMRDIKIHNAWSRTVPANFYVQNTLTAQQVSTESARVSGGLSYGDHNTGLNSGLRSGSLPALQARLLRADGSDGALMTITVNLQTRTGGVLATRSDGLSMSNVIFRSFTYTNEGLRIIREQQARPQK